jgi:hypothetical protein
MTAQVRRHAGQTERRVGVPVDRVVSALELGHHWPRSVMDIRACGRIDTEAREYDVDLSVHLATPRRLELPAARG